MITASEFAVYPSGETMLKVVLEVEGDKEKIVLK